MGRLLKPGEPEDLPLSSFVAFGKKGEEWI